MDTVFLMYVNSHIYDIYSVLTGTLTLACVAILKIPLKKFTHYIVYKNRNGFDKNQEKEVLRYRAYKRLNGLVILLAMMVAILLFKIISEVSSQIIFSWGSAIMSGIISIAEYEMLDHLL